MSLTAASVNAMDASVRFGLIRRTQIPYEVAVGVSWEWSEVTLAARSYPIDLLCAMMIDVKRDEDGHIKNQLMPDLCLGYACLYKNPDPRVRRFFAYALKTKLTGLGYDVEKVADGTTDIHPSDVDLHVSAVPRR
jgi:hypothetical protein